MPYFDSPRQPRRAARGQQAWLALGLAFALLVAFSGQAAAQPALPGGPVDPAAVVNTAAEPVVVEIYVDQYLADDSTLTAGTYETDFEAEPFGRRYLELEAGYYSANDDLLGDDLEQGLRLRWGRESLNWGSLDIEASIADVESDYLSRATQGSFGILTVRHSAMPVSATGQLYTTLGHQRSLANSFLQNSYRLRLPTSVLLGVGTELRSSGSAVRFSIGDTGINQGIRIPRFEATGGRLTTFGLDREVGEKFSVGAELADLRDDDDIRDHSSLLLGTRYLAADASQEHSARIMSDDDGNIALWTDSRHQMSRATTLRYGVFHFDPGIVWADLPINSDQEGVYVQADAGNAQFSLSGGYDYLDYGLESGASSSFEKHLVSVNGSLRLSRSLTVGLNSSLGDVTFSGVFGDEQTITRLDLFTSISRTIGGLRLDVFFDELDSAVVANRREREGAAASLNWDMPERVRLSTEVRVERNLDWRGATRRAELSTLVRYSLFDSVSLGLHASLYRTEGDLYSEDGGLGLSADASWSFLPNWIGTASLYSNQADIAGNDFLPGPAIREAGTNSLWVSVRYQQRSGQSFAPVGRRYDGTSGSGTLSGQVFFDANRDGIRQPSEEAAVGVTVLLDGRYETRTDQSGFYTFLPVPIGEHEVIVLMENLPLPWGLNDDTPRRARVSYRSTATVNFPLTIMD